MFKFRTVVASFVVLISFGCFGTVFGETKYSETEQFVADGADYAPNRLIVKYKEEAASVVETEFQCGKSANELDISPTLNAIHKEHKIKDIKPLFPNFRNNHKKLQNLKNKRKASMTRKEAKLMHRAERASKNAVVPDLDRIYVLEVETGEELGVKQLANKLSSDPDIEYAELDYVVSVDYTPNDPLYDCLWALNNTGQTYPYSGSYTTPPGTTDVDIDASEAWDIATVYEVVVAVIDTGVDYSHRDLDDNMWINSGEIADNGIDDDNNGYIDDIYGYDFSTYGSKLRDSDPADGHGHGTHCSGTIAAEGDNSLDVVGVNFGNAKIMALKFLSDSGSGYTSDAVDAINYAVLNGADVMSNSWGGSSYLQSLQDAINYAHSEGVAFIAAAGNSSTSSKSYPAAYDNVLAVAATDSNDDKASFSNYDDTSSPWVDVAAPGVDILSLRANGTSLGTIYDDYNTTSSGTSMACPHVAGVYSYLMAVMPAYDIDELYDIIMQSGDPIADGICTSDTRVNLDAAIQVAVSSEGHVGLDMATYSSSDTVSIRLFDYDIRYQSQQAVIITTTGGDSETVLLSESGYDIGSFESSINTTSDIVITEDGQLQVSHGETIIVTYQDSDDGTGNPATVISTASVDSQAPIVTNIQINVPGPDPVITFETNESAVGRVLCGTQCGGQYEFNFSSSLTTTHTLELVGIEELTEYYFVVEAIDAVGNLSVDDNSGNCYSFTTTGVGDIYVPSEVSTIQQAVEYSWDGGTIWLADGTYTGDGNRDIDLRGRAITIRSENGPDYCTIDCEGSTEDFHRAFIANSGESLSTKIIGVKITNGNYRGGFNVAGGVYVNSSGVTLENCVFYNNEANFGGAVYAVHSNLLMIDCIFDDNTAGGKTTSSGGAICFDNSFVAIDNCGFDDNSSGRGGAIYAYGSMNIQDSLFTSNSGNGGAIYSYGYSAVISNCIFSNNRGGSTDGGGAIFSQRSIEIYNTQFLNNRSSSSGGAISQGTFSGVLADTCVFSGNSASDNGGAIAMCLSKYTQLTNCIVASNTAAENGGAISVERIHDGESSDCDLDLEFCTFYDNQAAVADTLYFEVDPNNSNEYFEGKVINSILWGSTDQICFSAPLPFDVSYCDIQGGYIGVGNIDSYPFFVDAANLDIHLDPNSPCINAGDPNYVVGEDDYDIDGDIRVLGGRVDIGADEYTGIYSYQNDTWYLTIQAAIDASSDGDVIELSPGTYTGTGNRDIDFSGKAITVQSLDPNEWEIVEATVIDCQASTSDRHRGFYFHSGEDSNSIVSGLTITNGIGKVCSVEYLGNLIDLYSGCAILCDSSSPSIINCLIADNYNDESLSDGTISCLNYASPRIENCQIKNNTVRSCSGISCFNNSSPTILNSQINDNVGDIGGVSCINACSPTIQGCDISDNSKHLTGSTSATGGVFCSDASSPMISNCTINNNYATYGGALYFGEDCHPKMSNCLIAGNEVTHAGGAINGCYGNAEFTNCTIVNNVANRYYGGGMSFGLGGTPIITNCIIYGNSAPTGSQVHQVVTSPVYSYCDIEGSGGSANWDTTLGADGGGNIDISPEFVDPNNGDYHLSLSSPCIDAGDPNGTYLGQKDIDGDLRFAGINVDIGVDEYLGALNTTINEWYDNIQAAVDDASTGDVIKIYPGTYTGLGNRDIDFNGKAITVQSLDPNDWDVVEATIIDCEATDENRHRGFYFHSGEDANSVVSGLTITNGFGVASDGFYPGSAIFCDNYSSPFIKNCFFTENIDANSLATGTITCFNDANPVIDNCIFYNNMSNLSSAICLWGCDAIVTNCQMSGSSDSYCAIYCSEGSDGQITNCIISDNDFKGVGGIKVYDSSPAIESCLILNNSGKYGGMELLESESVVRNCMITDNVGSSAGGAFYIYAGDVSITGCTISGNEADTGGGVYNFMASTDFSNCIIWGNSASNTGDDLYSFWSPDVTCSYCDIEGSNGSGTDWDSDLGIDSGDNIDLDPNFVDPSNGDYHLESNSPCIDTGDSTASYDNQADFEGDPRVLNGNPDIGADEVSCFSVGDGTYEIWVAAGKPASWCDYCQSIGDANGDGYVDGLDTQRFIDAFGTVIGQAGYNPDADTNHDGVVNGSDTAIFSANFGTACQ